MVPTTALHQHRKVLEQCGVRRQVVLRQQDHIRAREHCECPKPLPSCSYNKAVADTRDSAFTRLEESIQLLMYVYMSVFGNLNYERLLRTK